MKKIICIVLAIIMLIVSVPFASGANESDLPYDPDDIGSMLIWGYENCDLQFSPLNKVEGANLANFRIGWYTNVRTVCVVGADGTVLTEHTYQGIEFFLSPEEYHINDLTCNDESALLYAKVSSGETVSAMFINGDEVSIGDMECVCLGERTPLELPSPIVFDENEHKDNPKALSEFGKYAQSISDIVVSYRKKDMRDGDHTLADYKIAWLTATKTVCLVDAETEEILAEVRPYSSSSDGKIYSAYELVSRHGEETTLYEKVKSSEKVIVWLQYGTETVHEIGEVEVIMIYNGEPPHHWDLPFSMTDWTAYHWYLHSMPDGDDSNEPIGNGYAGTLVYLEKDDVNYDFSALSLAYEYIPEGMIKLYLVKGDAHVNEDLICGIELACQDWDLYPELFGMYLSRGTIPVRIKGFNQKDKYPYNIIEIPIVSYYGIPESAERTCLYTTYKPPRIPADMASAAESMEAEITLNASTVDYWGISLKNLTLVYEAGSTPGTFGYSSLCLYDGNVKVWQLYLRSSYQTDGDIVFVKGSMTDAISKGQVTLGLFGHFYYNNYNNPDALEHQRLLEVATIPVAEKTTYFESLTEEPGVIGDYLDCDVKLCFEYDCPQSLDGMQIAVRYENDTAFIYAVAKNGDLLECFENGVYLFAFDDYQSEGISADDIKAAVSEGEIDVVLGELLYGEYRVRDHRKIPFVILDDIQSVGYVEIKPLASVRMASVSVSFILGDINEDGKFNSRDIITLMKSLVGEGQINEDKADVNFDGKLNAKDVLVLMCKMVNGSTLTSDHDSLLCCLFGHALTASYATETVHNAYTSSPHCVKNTYLVISCGHEGCDYIEKILTSSKRITTCHG